MRLLDGRSDPSVPGTVVRVTPTASAERAEWISRFVDAIARRAALPGRFTTFEVAAEAQLPDPPSPNLAGVATGIAHRDGLIVAVAATPSLRPRTSKSLVRVWVGTRYAPVDPDDVFGGAR